MLDKILCFFGLHVWEKERVVSEQGYSSVLLCQRKSCRKWLND